MTFAAIIKHCLTSGFIDFRGRASRGEYWCFLFFCVLMWSCGCWLLEGLGMLPGLVQEGTRALIYEAGTAVALLLLLPFCAVHVRRLHDMNRSGLRLLPMGALLLACSPLLMSGFWISMLGDTLGANLKMPFGPGIVLAFFVRRTVFAAGTLADNAQVLGITLAGRSPALYGNLFPLMTVGYTIFNLLLGGIFAYLSRRSVDEDNRYGPVPPPLAVNPAGTDFLASLLRCLGPGYRRFQGRAPRSEFWWFSLAQALVCNAWFLSLGGNSGLWTQHSGWSLVLAVGLAYGPQLPLLLPGLAVMIRRLHDRGKSGAWLVLLLEAEVFLYILATRLAFHGYGSPDVKTVLFLICLALAPNLWLLHQLVRRGTSGRNAYGPDPLERSGMAADPASPAARAGRNSPAASPPGNNSDH